MTVADLIGLLQTLDPNLPVFIECVDDYYSGPVTADRIMVGTAVHYEAYDQTISTDEYGKKIKQWTQHFSECWRATSDGLGGTERVIERKPCLIIRAE